MVCADRVAPEKPFPSGLPRTSFVGASVGGRLIYIYTLSDPRSGSIRYIGKTKNIQARLNAHISKAKAHHVDHHCARWIRGLLAEGVTPHMSVLQELPSGADWQRAEADAITRHRAMGHELTNLTGGGDGFHDCPPEVLKRRGESRRRTLSDPEKRAEFVDRLAEARATPEVRAKKSASVKAAWGDPVKQRNILSGMRAPDAVQRRAIATLKRMNDPETYARHCAKSKEIAQSAAGLAQLAAARTKRWSDPEARERHRLRMQEFYSDPERRKAAGDASRKRWNKS